MRIVVAAPALDVSAAPRCRRVAEGQSRSIATLCGARRGKFAPPGSPNNNHALGRGPLVDFGQSPQVRLLLPKTLLEATPRPRYRRLSHVRCRTRRASRTGLHWQGWFERAAKPKRSSIKVLRGSLNIAVHSSPIQITSRRSTELQPSCSAYRTTMPSKVAILL